MFRSLFRVIIVTNIFVFSMISLAPAATAKDSAASVISASLPGEHEESGSVSGSVTGENGEEIVGASVQLFAVGSALARHSGVTSENGMFSFSEVSEGHYEVIVSHIGFGRASLRFAVEKDLDSELQIVLHPSIISYPEVVVSSGRARERLSPVTVTNISAQDLAEQPDMKDLPVHLARQPGITYHSENGNAIGYSTLRMRGFGQRRLAVAINGIPQNDPEEFNVFWINFFDIQGAVQDIQIQRGAGSSVYGPTAIGGAINMRAMPYKSEFEASLHVGGGAFGTRRVSVELNSGLLKDRWMFFSRVSRLESDGYRDWSWTEFWRFFVGVTRVTARSSVTLQSYGGPQKDGLAFSGIPKAANKAKIDDGFGGTIDRKYNFSAFDSDVEDFHQPHIELHHEFDLNERIRFSQALFWIKGVGFFDFGGTFRSADYLRLPAGTVGPGLEGEPLFISRPDISLLFRANLDQWQVGWMPRLTLTDDNSTTTLGAEARLHRSLRWGRIQEASEIPSSFVGSDSDVRVYSFRGEKVITSAYANHLERISDRWAIQGDVQLTYRRYRIWDEEFYGTSFSKPYTFINPRIGLTFLPEQPFSAFASVALASREPRMKTLYDGEESGAGFEPQFERRADQSFDFDNPLVTPEHLVDVEMGASILRRTYFLKVNIFIMDFRDEIVPSGGLDQFGVPRTGNADRTRHIGLELEGDVALWPNLNLNGNITLSRNRFVTFDEFNSGVGPPENSTDRSGNVIAGFPERTGNARLSYRKNRWFGSVMASIVGKQYIDNGQGRNADGRKIDDLTLERFALLDASFSYQAGQDRRLRLGLDVNNVLNDRVLTYGNVSFGQPQFFPAATRHLFVSAKYTFR